jgi:aspartate/methionine/tyrosine aminotransferase
VGYHVPSVQALSKKLAEEEGILIHPARILGSDDHHMRIGLGREGFAEALQKFEQWLEKDL